MSNALTVVRTEFSLPAIIATANKPKQSIEGIEIVTVDRLPQAIQAAGL